MIMDEDKINRLKDRLAELQPGSEEHIRCLANIMYLAADERSQSTDDIKLVFVLGLYKVFGDAIGGEVINLAASAFDMLFTCDVKKATCLFSAVLKSLEEKGKNE